MAPKSLRVLFLTEGRDVPASRFRAEQFFPELERHGIRCTLLGGYGPLYHRLHGTLAGPPYKLAARLKRALAGALGVRYDAVFLQRTAVPHTALPERALARLHPHLVLDFDDALWLGPGGRPSVLRRRAFRRAVECVQWVVAGNRFLAAHAGAPEKTTVLPTVIDTDRYVPDPRRRADGLVVGWMGTAPNLPFLRAVMPDVLSAVEQVPGARVRIVSNGELPELRFHPRVEQLRWTRETEIPLLQSFDVGLMPLPDDELTRGKCGFKMIQYMAVGAAVVASAVGANVELFEGSNAGVLVPPGESFGPAVLELLRDADRRREAARCGRAHAVAHLSVPPVAARYAEIFRRVASG
ncbi:MAG TPA: glycosyltransferase [Sandaracinaceae bacterium]